MLFYAMLTIAGIITAAVVVWIVKSLSEASRSAYRTLSPSARGRSESRLAHLNQNLVTAPSPWGWSSQERTTPSIQTFGDSTSHHNPVPVRRDREPPTLTSQALRASSIELLVEGIADPAPINSARNVLTGYDLSKRGMCTAATHWPYHAQATGKASAASVEPDKVVEQTAQQTRETPQAVVDKEPDSPAESSQDKPWGW